jgi:hypothetical protein
MSPIDRWIDRPADRSSPAAYHASAPRAVSAPVRNNDSMLMGWQSREIKEEGIYSQNFLKARAR